MTKPRIILSRCFLKPVRYDGGIINDEFVEKLKNFVEIIDVCPEVDIGLGVPRERIIIVKEEDEKKLLQPDTGIDLTDKMIDYISRVLEEMKDIDGALLKSKSPSCGVESTKLYYEGNVHGRTNGFLAEGIKRRFPYLPVEDEERLKDKEIRFYFLVRIFSLAELRELSKNLSISKLIDFHTKYKYLLMIYNPKALEKLERIVADKNMGIDEKYRKYSEIFHRGLKTKPKSFPKRA